MIYYIDIDDTICRSGSPSDYSTAVPISKAIKKVNEMYDNGHEIIFWTARGSGTGIDWKELTESQLKEWGVKYHKLVLGKPVYDFFIDDKNINSKDWLNE